MKLDVNALRYMDREAFRVLTSVEMGMKNHEVVPAELVSSIAGLRHGGAHKILNQLLKDKLVSHDRRKYDGYKLTYRGYDYLALKTLVNRGVIAGIGKRIGVGKESEIFIAVDGEGRQLAVKLHRLGRVTFKSIKRNRDYLQKRKSASWLYLSRLAALKEYAYLKALYENKFPVPVPVEQNRHCVLMELVSAYPMVQIKEIRHPGAVYSILMNILLKFASYGLIHGDFNEFNLLIDEEENVTVIDFPQMVSTSHTNAEMYFDRDVTCIVTYFRKKFGYDGGEFPNFQKDVAKKYDLDVHLTASGWTTTSEQELEQLVNEQKSVEEKKGGGGSSELKNHDEGSEEEDDDGDDEEEEDDDDGDDDGPSDVVNLRGGEDVDVDAIQKEVESLLGPDEVDEEDNKQEVASSEASESSSGEEDEDEAEDEKLKVPDSQVRTVKKKKVHSEKYIKDQVRAQLKKKQAQKSHRNNLKNKEKRRLGTVIQESK